MYHGLDWLLEHLFAVLYLVHGFLEFQHFVQLGIVDQVENREEASVGPDIFLEVGRIVVWYFFGLAARLRLFGFVRLLFLVRVLFKDVTA